MIKHHEQELLPWYAKPLCLILFCIAMVCLTFYTMRRITRKHAIKVASGYKFDPNDLIFDTY